MGKIQNRQYQDRLVCTLLTATVWGLFSTRVLASCGSAFCTLNTHWDAQGLRNNDSLRVDLRYSYARADELHRGSSKIAPALPSNAGKEIENLRTINQILNLGVDCAINSKWNVAIGVPLVMRDHAHTFDPLAPDAPFVQQAEFSALGDVQITGKYRFYLSDYHAGSGAIFGFKLPTGSINKTMTPPDPADPTTPFALDRSSQPGTGSTDVILGTYYYRDMPNLPWGWFVSGLMQNALTTRDHYRPGDALSLDVGVHYSITHSVIGLLQLNTQTKARDHGANAEPASGGYSINLSPGLSFAIARKTKLYGFVQLPLVQYANGDPADPAVGQLTAPWSVTVGASHSF